MSKILIIGTGTIGEPLIGLFCRFKKEFGLSEIIFHKRTPLKTDRSKVRSLMNIGAKLAVDSASWLKFEEIGLIPSYNFHEAMNEANVVIDCTPCGNKNKEMWYSRNYQFNDSVKGFIAQGSESDFGIPYAFGINDDALSPGIDRFIQVVSCNTHNLAAVVQLVAKCVGGYDKIRNANFLCIRRSNDISQSNKFVPSPTAGKHDDKEYGTHHAADVSKLLRTRTNDIPKIFSSAIKLNTQYMHMIYFNISTDVFLSKTGVLEEISKNDRIAFTNKNSSNEVFSFGRDHGHYGRILNQTVMHLPSLHISEDGRNMTGFCFTPQDGNSLVSSVASALWYVYPDSYQEKLNALEKYYFNEI